MNLSASDRSLAQRDVFGDTLIELIDADPDVYVLDGDLANSTKADKVSGSGRAAFSRWASPSRT